jgi:hypothetical protein
MSHAKLSPSAAERWMTCPGSVVLAKDMPQKSSVFAEEGTQAHELAEKLLTANTFTIDADEGMLDNVMVYVDHVTSLGGTRFVEERVRVTDNLWGTADAVVWQPSDKHLHIVDLKYGAGVPVEVIGNLQLKIYALATLLTFEYPAEKVTATIVQPRCPHSDGPVRSVTYDVVELVDFYQDLLEAIERVEKVQEFEAKGVWDAGYINPSEKGCRWCLASPICPALKTLAQSAAKTVFAKGLPYDPAELAATLDTLPLLEGWIKNVREFAYEEAERGTAIPDWKLVEKRATRKWREDESVVVHRLMEATELTEYAIYDDPSIKSPAAIEKLLPKEQRALLDELCVKESSGHTLVHGSDKRPAIKVDAKSAFANS